ncbi:MAG: ribonuclease P protein component [Microthrixaceae bacterium]|nr:ribonuclease P protein component [Microthrixaceae bacterium]
MPSSQGSRPPVGLTWRLTGRQAFHSLRRAGRKGHSGPVTVISAPSSAARPRVAFALSRKVGTAVTRNLIRRRLRALMSEAEQQGRLPINDYLIVGAPAITTLSYPQLRDHLSAAVRSANRPRSGVAR